MDVKLTDYKTVEEIAKIWGITTRQVHHYCTAGRIPGVMKISRFWMIPENAQKPLDGRYKVKEPKSAPTRKAASHTDVSKLSASFNALIGNKELNYQILDLLPIPLQIFSPDGLCIFINRASTEMTGDTERNVVGKYNYNNDPICLGIMGQDVYDRVSRGEAVSFPDFPAPIQDTLDKGYIDEKPFEAATMDLFFLPIWDGDIFTCTILFYTVKNMYKGRADIARAQKYIDEHWMDEFDLDKIAQTATLSRRHFQRIFKEIAGVTPMRYYQNKKIEKIQEKLLDENSSIEQAFDACGADIRGVYHKLFKENMKMSPSGYRKANGLK